MQEASTCLSCKVAFVGKLCHECGKPKNLKIDLSLLEFYKDVFYNTLALSSKFLEGIKDLCFPGRVTNLYIAGDRSEHIRPLQLFGVVNLLFYLILFNVSVFFTRIDDMADGYHHWLSANNYFHYDIANAIQRLSERYVLQTADINQGVETDAGNFSKALLILLVPTWGFLIYLISRNKSNLFLKAHVLAFNCLSFYMLTGMIYIYSLFHIRQGVIDDLGLLPFHIVFAGYVWLSVYKVYKLNQRRTTIISMLSLVAFFFLISVYRQFTLMLAVWLFNKKPFLDLFQYRVLFTIIALLTVKGLFDLYVKKKTLQHNGN